MTLDAIVFLHRGDTEYLRAALLQARKSNPHSRIVLLGDAHNSQHSDIIEYHVAEEYNKLSRYLRDIYVHMSTNSAVFEYLCIERWMVMADFCNRNNIETAFHADTDVLIYADLTQTLRRLGDFDVSMSSMSCGHASYWLSNDALNAFSELIVRSYESQIDRLELIRKRFTDAGLPGGVSDMALLELFWREDAFRFLEATEVVGNATFDHNINHAGNGSVTFIEHLGAKKLFWAEGMPHGQDASDGRLIRFDALHFQGQAKFGLLDVFEREGQVYDDVLGVGIPA